MSTISPGCRLPRTRLAIVVTVMPPEVPSQPSVSTVKQQAAPGAAMTAITVATWWSSLWMRVLAVCR